jgi:hypothetical protein
LQQKCRAFCPAARKASRKSKTLKNGIDAESPAAHPQEAPAALKKTERL